MSVRFVYAVLEAQAARLGDQKMLRICLQARQIHVATCQGAAPAKPHPTAIPSACIL